MHDLIDSDAMKQNAQDASLGLDERRQSLVGQIAADIARDIADGKLGPGADLNSVELAARFQTSRTPVREALLLLEKEGLVDIPPRRRPRVAHVTMEEIEELYEIRVALNCLMIRQFIGVGTDEDMAEMRRIFAELVSAAERRDEADFFEVRGRLHNFWTDRCGNASLRRLLKTWKMRLSVNRLGALHDFDRVLKDNERLVIACEERDAPLGEALMASLTHYGREMIRERISRN